MSITSLFLWVVNYWEIAVGSKYISVNSPLKVTVISLFITVIFGCHSLTHLMLMYEVLHIFSWMLLEALKNSFWQLYCPLNNLSILISYRMWLIHVLKHTFLLNFRTVIAMQSYTLFLFIIHKEIKKSVPLIRNKLKHLRVEWHQTRYYICTYHNV